MPVQPPKPLLGVVKDPKREKYFEAAICPEPIAVKPLTMLSIPNSGSSWANGYDGNDSAEMRCSHLYAPNRELSGAHWPNAALCGPVAVALTVGPLALHGGHSGRGVSDPKQVPHAMSLVDI